MNLIFRLSILFILFLSLNNYSSEFNSSISIKLDPVFMQKNSTVGAIKLLLPVPKGAISVDASVQISIDQKLLKTNFFLVNTWPNNQIGTIKKSVDKSYIRLLLIEIEKQAIYPTQLKVSWRNHQQQQLVSKTSLMPTTATLIYPSQSWLAQALLLHPKYNQDDNKWYIEPQKKYAKYFTNQTLLTENGYSPEKSSQWLYDRPQAIYQLFIMSGERQWLTQGNRLSRFYQQHIDDEGQFTLRSRFDAKYLMPKGLLYDFLLSGNNQAKNALKKIFQASLAWDEHYSASRGFWTERNQAAALNTAISYWEISHDETALARINSIIEATIEMTFNPQNDWSLRGCPQHSFKSHEGWGDDSPACSPWMMALLGDALWRFYRLTGDKNAAALIDAFGDFILNHGLFYGDKRVNNIVVPKYIVAIENSEQEELNQWTDPQHACDVAALLGKSVYIKEVSGDDSFMVKTLFSALLEQCQLSYDRLKQEQKKHKLKEYWSLKPPRRFAWLYSTTSDLPWLNLRLISTY